MEREYTFQFESRGALERNNGLFFEEGDTRRGKIKGE